MTHAQTSGIGQARALAWEFLAHGWRSQLLGLVGIVGFASLIYSVFAQISDLSFQGTETGSSMHFGFFWVTLTFLGAPILAAWGSPQRRYTLPTSSFIIVACPMVCSMVSIFVLYTTAAVALNLLFDAGWSIWRPALVAAVLVAWLQAILWATSNSQGLQFVSCLASAGVVLLGIAVHPSPNGLATGWFFYEGVTPAFVLMFSLTSLACVSVGTLGFANLRHGGGFEVERIADWASRLFPKTARTTPFSSPTSAQFWLEWTEGGYVLPVGTTLLGVAVLLIAPFVTPDDSREFFSAVSAILLIPAFLVGLFLGSRSEGGHFGNFNGSCPLADGQIANAVLTSVTVGVLSSALIWAGVLGAAFLILGQPIDLSSLQREIQHLDTIHLFEAAIRLLGIVILGMGAIWGTVALITSIVLAGRKVGVVVVSTVAGGWIVGGIGSELLLASEFHGTFQRVFFFTFVALTLIGTIAAFVAGWWMKLISHGTLLLAATIVVVMFTGAHVVFGFTSNPTSYFPALWGCCLTPFALAGAPLAVWWNRHR